MDHTTESWMALYLSIIKQVTPEIAFNMLDGAKPKIRKSWTRNDIEDVVAYRNQGMTLKDIAEIMGVKRNNMTKRWGIWRQQGMIKEEIENDRSIYILAE